MDLPDDKCQMKIEFQKEREQKSQKIAWKIEMSDKKQTSKEKHNR